MKSTEMINNEICERIKSRRKFVGMTQEQTAQELGIGRPAYAAKEACTNRFNISEIVKLSTLFGVSTCWLLEGDAEKQGGLTNDETRALNVYRSLDEKGRQKLIMFGVDLMLGDDEKITT